MLSSPVTITLALQGRGWGLRPWGARRPSCGARLEHGVVAEVRSHERPPLDPAEQVAPGGVGLDDDGRGPGRGVVHQDGDLEGQERVGLGHAGEGRYLGGGRRPGSSVAGEQAHVAQGVLFQRGQEIGHRGQRIALQRKAPEHIGKSPVPHRHVQLLDLVLGVPFDGA